MNLAQPEKLDKPEGVNNDCTARPLLRPSLGTAEGHSDALSVRTAITAGV